MAKALFEVTRRTVLAGASVTAITLPGDAALATAAPAAAADKLSVGWLASGTGAPSPIFAALSARAARGDLVLNVSQRSSVSDADDVLKVLEFQGQDLIVTDIAALEGAAAQLASSSSGAAFLVARPAGAQDFDFSFYAGGAMRRTAYRRGLFAGSETATNKIGMVGRLAVAEVRRLFAAFTDGALAANPRATFLVNFTNSVDERAAEARQLAAAMVAHGADVVFGPPMRGLRTADGRDVVTIAFDDPVAVGGFKGSEVKAMWQLEPTLDRIIAYVKSTKWGMWT